MFSIAPFSEAPCSGSLLEGLGMGGASGFEGILNLLLRVSVGFSGKERVDGLLGWLWARLQEETFLLGLV